MDGGSSNAPVQQLTAEAAAQLQEGIGLVLTRWTALQMAIENEWGGRDTREKSNQLNVDIFSAFTQSKEKVYMDDIEEILDEFMISLNTEVNDGSLEEVAEKLMYMHEECLEGDFNSIKVLRETNVGRRPATYVRQVSIPCYRHKVCFWAYQVFDRSNCMRIEVKVCGLCTCVARS
ncbi:uncharacterized protein [Solanum lycopersicum]|uniref:uncharacterized protein isoform X2 n=1 Tax=Solanum lycopersicum TaxID=4081 RepID=UPI000E1E1B35|nr:pre-rRNA-processing protein TSR2 homolog isoform X2 [Solanum lycopersicum]